MMVELFRHQGGTRHKAEGLVEIREHEFLADRVAAFHFAPAIEPGQRATASITGKLVRHVQTSSVKSIAAYAAPVNRRQDRHLASHRRWRGPLWRQAVEPLVKFPPPPAINQTGIWRANPARRRRGKPGEPW